MNIFKRIFYFFSITFFSLSIYFFPVTSVKADFSSLTPCKDSQPFQKRLSSSIKKLENRLKFYTPESKETSSILKEIQNTKNRFEKYKQENLLCGKEGLPHLITTGQWDRANEFVLPGLLFLYITGWIGWSGRSYLKYSSKSENPYENEIILNVPVAISIINSGFLWPIDAWKEFTNGDLLESDDNITNSPR